jgi:ABC-type siderophore export system fused ATPase/permease subunit
MWGISRQAEKLLASNEGLSYDMVFSQFIYLTVVSITFILTCVSGFLDTLVAIVLSIFILYMSSANINVFKTGLLFYPPILLAVSSIMTLRKDI